MYSPMLLSFVWSHTECITNFTGNAALKNNFSNQQWQICNQGKNILCKISTHKNQVKLFSEPKSISMLQTLQLLQGNQEKWVTREIMKHQLAFIVCFQPHGNKNRNFCLKLHMHCLCTHWWLPLICPFYHRHLKHS